MLFLTPFRLVSTNWRCQQKHDNIPPISNSPIPQRNINTSFLFQIKTIKPIKMLLPVHLGAKKPIFVTSWGNGGKRLISRKNTLQSTGYDYFSRLGEILGKPVSPALSHVALGVEHSWGRNSGGTPFIRTKWHARQNAKSIRKLFIFIKFLFFFYKETTIESSPRSIYILFFCIICI